MPSSLVRPLLINFGVVLLLGLASLALSGARMHKWAYLEENVTYYYHDVGLYPTYGFTIAQLVVGAFSVIVATLLAITLRSTSNKLDQGLENRQSNTLGKQLRVALIVQALVTFLEIIIGLAHYAWFGHWVHVHLDATVKLFAAAEVAIWVLLCLAQIASVGLLFSAYKQERTEMLETQQRERDVEETSESKYMAMPGNVISPQHPTLVTLERTEETKANDVSGIFNQSTHIPLQSHAAFPTVNTAPAFSPSRPTSPAANNPLFRSLQGY